MRRRTYLAAVGATTSAFLAGCGGTTGGNGSNGTTAGGGGGSATETSGDATPTAEESTETVAGPMGTSSGTESPTPTSMREPSPTATAGSEMMTTMGGMGTPMSTATGGGGGGSADVSIDSSELVSQSDAGITTVAMAGELTAPSYLSSLELQARFRNDAGDIVGTQPAFFQGLDEGQTWSFYIPSLATDPPSDGEVAVASATAGQPPSNPGAEVVESSLNEPADEFSGPTVTGRAENTSGSQISYLEARVKFLTDDGTALGSDFTNVSNLPAGETWSFEVEQITYSTDPRPEVADFDITLASGL